METSNLASLMQQHKTHIHRICVAFNIAEEDEYDESGVQLGFVEEVVDGEHVFCDKNWMNWDGGKAGGKPVSVVLRLY